MGAKTARRKKAQANKKGWKDLQTETKARQKVQVAIAILGLLLLFLLIAWMVHFTRSMLNPWNMSLVKSYQWNEKFNINLLIHSSNITLLSFNPKEAKLFVIYFPDQTFIDVAHGFGSWQLGSVYQLGGSQKDLDGNKLLADTLSSFLGLPIDGVLDFGKSPKEGNEIIKALRQSPFAIVTMLKDFKSNLSVFELVKLNMKIARIRFDKEQVIDLAKLNMLEKQNLADQTPVLMSDPVKLDNILQDLADPQIVSERLSIAVLNATSHSQLAQKAARLVTNLGGNVIAVANAENLLPQTQVLGLNSQTLIRLKQIFEQSGKISKPAGNSIYERAQITILLGEDYSNNQ